MPAKFHEILRHCLLLATKLHRVLFRFVGIHSNEIGLFAHLYTGRCPCTAMVACHAHPIGRISRRSDVTESTSERTIAFGS